MTQPLQPAKYYAKLICQYMKNVPGQYADDPKDVQKALGLSDAEFKLGLDLCVQRGVIELDDDLPTNSTPVPVTKVFSVTETKSTSPFSMDEDEDEDLAEAIG